MNYNVDYFIEKFTAIPDHLWGTGHFYNSGTGTRCARGLCRIGTAREYEDYVAWVTVNGIPREEAICEEEAVLKQLFDDYGFGVTLVNDGNITSFITVMDENGVSTTLINFKHFGDTPKERVLYFLHYFKELEEEQERKTLTDSAITEVNEILKEELVTA